MGLNLQMTGEIAQLFDFSMFGWIWPGLRNQVLALLIGASLLAASAVGGQNLLALSGALVLSIGFGLAGHAQSDGMPDLLWTLVGFHVFVAGFWLLAPLSLWPRNTVGHDLLLFRLRRFSRVAVIGVPLMIAAGLWLAFILGDGWSGLIATAYGRLLLTKLGIVAIALSLGAYNKVRLTEQVRSNAAGARRHLGQSLSLEFILFMAALVVVAAATTVFGPHA